MLLQMKVIEILIKEVISVIKIRQINCVIIGNDLDLQLLPSNGRSVLTILKLSHEVSNLIFYGWYYDSFCDCCFYFNLDN